MSAYVDNAAECSEQDDDEMDDDGSAGSMADFINDDELEVHTSGMLAENARACEVSYFFDAVSEI